MNRLVDLSHPLHNGMTTHPGIPGPTVKPYLTREELAAHYAPGVSFELTYLEMVTSIGTYVDSPAHRHSDMNDLASVPLERYADLPGLVVDARGREHRAIGPGLFADLPLAGKAVLVRTDWDARWGAASYWEAGPFLTDDACHLLVNEQAALVGVDFGNVDDRQEVVRPAHTVLLAAELGLVENLRGLGQLPPTGFRFHAAPLAVRGGMAFPVRAYALVES